MKSKYSEIRFPIFTKKEVPLEEVYRGKRLFILPFGGNENKLLLVDDLNIKETSYIKRLSLLKHSEFDIITYDFTCLNLSSLLLSKSRWGYDSSKKTHRFETHQDLFPISYRKVTKISKNAFWVNDISYPFELPYHLIDPENLKNIWIGLVYIDNCWHVYEFSTYFNTRNKIRL